MMLHFIYSLISLLTPFLAYYIFENINNGKYNCATNFFLVSTVLVTKLIKPFLRVYADGKLLSIGLSMQGVLMRAVIDKTFKISLLSNHNVTGSGMIKIMQADIDRIITYVKTKSYMLNGFFGVALNIVILTYLFGLAGFIGIFVYTSILTFRVCFVRIIDSYEGRLAEQTSHRVRSIMDIFGIIKYIKVAALEMPYFKKLVGMRES